MYATIRRKPDDRLRALAWWVMPWALRASGDVGTGVVLRRLWTEIWSLVRIND